MGVRGRVVLLLILVLVLLGAVGACALVELARTGDAGLTRAARLAAGFGGAALALGLTALAAALALLARLRVLSGRIPICAGCKRVRDDRGVWNRLEAFLEAHSHAEFTHGLCEVCQEGLHARTLEGSSRSVIAQLEPDPGS